jgi:hypothetical protein
MKQTGAAILVSRGTKDLQAAPAAYPYRSAGWLSRSASMSPGNDNAIKAGDPPIARKIASPESPAGYGCLIHASIAVAALFVISIVSLCIVPGLIFRSHYGRAPLTVQEYHDTAWKVKVGMTADEVRAAIGTPHEIVPCNMAEGATTWYYYTDSFAFGFFGVNFNADGRVISSWIP